MKRMKALVLATIAVFGAVSVAASPVMAKKRVRHHKVPRVKESVRLERTLRGLDPGARLEQICDYTALTRIGKDKEYRPDRAVGNAISPTKVEKDTLKADGAALRSRNKWYHLSYTCRTTPDHMKVLSFSYKVGEEIPKDKWESYALW